MKKTNNRYTVNQILELLNIKNDESKEESDTNNPEKRTKNKDILNKISEDNTNDQENYLKELEMINELDDQFIIGDLKDTDLEKDLIKNLYNPKLSEDDEKDCDKSLNSSENVSSQEYSEDEESISKGYSKDKNDKYDKKGNNINQNQEKVTNKYNNLNNLKNPFVRASLKSEYEKNTLISELNNSSKYEDHPPKFFEKLNSVKLDKQNIEEINLCGILSENNHWYNNIVYKGKKFNTMSNYQNLYKSDKISYFCSLHRTTKDSKKGDNKKLRHSKCNARIVYIKEESQYYMDWDHSKFCKESNPPFLDNISDINKEVNNYKNFRKLLNEFLDANPLVNYKTFKQKADKLYYKIKCVFEIKKNTYKNIYNTWKNSAKVFTKYSVLESPLTKDNTPYLRDYSYTLIYNSNGKSQFIHEHMIFISNFFIRKLQSSTHWYVDGTFVYPNEFSQLIVILYRDDILEKRFPGLYALINNKKYEGYKFMFEKIKNIISLEGSVELKLESYTLDFEIALQKTFLEIFPKIRCIGCFYHYCRNLREKPENIN